MICPPRTGTAVGSDRSLSVSRRGKKSIQQVFITKFVYPGRWQQLISKGKYNVLSKKGGKGDFLKIFIEKLVLLVDYFP